MLEHHRIKYLQRLVEKQRIRIECLEHKLKDLREILEMTYKLRKKGDEEK